MYRILVLTNEPLCLALVKDGKKEIIARTKHYGEYFTDVLDAGLRCLERNRKISLSKVVQKPKPVSTNIVEVKAASDSELPKIPAKEPVQELQKTGKPESMQEEEKLNVTEKRTRKRVSKKKVL